MVRNMRARKEQPSLTESSYKSDFFRPDRDVFSSMRAQHVLSYHLILSTMVGFNLKNLFFIFTYKKCCIKKPYFYLKLILKWLEIESVIVPDTEPVKA